MTEPSDPSETTGPALRPYLSALRPSNGHATASLTLGATGIALSVIPVLNVLSYLLGLLAATFGLVGLVRGAAVNHGKTKAIAGAVLGIAGMMVATSVNLWAYHHVRDWFHDALEQTHAPVPADAAQLEVTAAGGIASIDYQTHHHRVPTLKQLKHDDGYIPSGDVRGMRILKTRTGFCVQAADTAGTVYRWTYKPHAADGTNVAEAGACGR